MQVIEVTESTTNYTVVLPISISQRAPATTQQRPDIKQVANERGIVDLIDKLTPEFPILATHVTYNIEGLSHVLLLQQGEHDRPLAHATSSISTEQSSNSKFGDYFQTVNNSFATQNLLRRRHPSISHQSDLSANPSSPRQRINNAEITGLPNDLASLPDAATNDLFDMRTQLDKLTTLVNFL